MENTARKPSVLKRILKIILIILLVIIGILVLGIGYLSIVEYKPADVEVVSISDEYPESTVQHVRPETTYSIMTWNVGYGALGDNADFFMDGGTKVITADKDRVLSNLNGMISEIHKYGPDFIFLQEADINSTRSQHVDGVEMFREGIGFRYSTFAYNFNSQYVPYPIPPIGHVESGLLTLTNNEINYSERVKLPCPFSWPVRIVNLKRCLMVDRSPVYDAQGNDTGKELVLINLHLEAYDSGEGKIAQTKQLKEYMQNELEKGNYVIVGGDFNQTFSNCDTAAYPKYPGMWECGAIDTSEFSNDWTFIMDPSVPTCRSLDRPYNGETPDSFQFYMIDGFIVSSNVDVVSYETIDEGFTYTDHNPVFMVFELN